MPIDLGTLAVLAGSLIAAGVVAGILAGLLGIGGGIVLVPVLFQVFTFLDVPEAIRMQLAVGTSLATIIATSISSMRSHHKRGAVDWSLLSRWGPAVAVGVICGTIIAGSVHGDVLTAVFGTVAALVAVHMAIGSDRLKLADRLPGEPIRSGTGVVIGTISSMMGIGGATLSVPTLVMCSYPIRRAVGTASAIGLVIAVPGAIGFMIAGWGVAALPVASLGFVNLLGFALIIPATVLSAPLGARLAHGIPPRLLRIAFGVFLALTSARMFYSFLS